MCTDSHWVSEALTLVVNVKKYWLPLIELIRRIQTFRDLSLFFGVEQRYSNKG